MRMIQVSESLYERLTHLTRKTDQSPDRLAEKILQTIVALTEQATSASVVRRKVNRFVAFELSVLAGAGQSVFSQAGEPSLLEMVEVS